MKDFPEYSDEARDTLDLFVLDSVSTIFYFEDSDHEAVYERLLDKLIPNLRKFAVVCLGGKSKVIAKAKEPRTQDKISVFIVDKDFDDLLGLVENIDGLYYLQKNCLENYFLDMDALKSVCIEEKPNDLTNDKSHRLMSDKQTFQDELENRYQQITRLFIIARRYKIQRVVTTKMKIDDLLKGADPNYPVPTEEWCSNFRRELQSNCHERENEWLASDEQLDSELANAFVPENGAVALTANVIDHLNGKHMFKCLVRYVKSRLNVDIEKIDSQTLYLRLLANLNLNDLQGLKDKIVLENPLIILEN